MKFHNIGNKSLNFSKNFLCRFILFQVTKFVEEEKNWFELVLLKEKISYESFYDVSVTIIDKSIKEIETNIKIEMVGDWKSMKKSSIYMQKILKEYTVLIYGYEWRLKL